MSYWDSSALVKLYVREPDSGVPRSGLKGEPGDDWIANAA
jgi:predicted nucleic acid-binding protein